MSAKHAGLSLDGRGKVRGEHPIVTGSRVALFFQMDKKTKGTKYLSWKIHYAACNRNRGGFSRQQSIYIAML